MRTLTKLTTPAETDSVSADSGVASEALEGRIKGASPLARDTVSPNSHPFSRQHESAIKHVTGRADYIDDLKAPADAIHVALGLSPVAHGRLTRLDLEAIRRLPGVIDSVGFADVPVHTVIVPVF